MELGLRQALKSPSFAATGSSRVKSLSTILNSAGTAYFALNQWMVTLTFRPSGDFPPALSGS